MEKGTLQTVMGTYAMVSDDLYVMIMLCLQGSEIVDPEPTSKSTNKVPSVSFEKLLTMPLEDLPGIYRVQVSLQFFNK